MSDDNRFSLDEMDGGAASQGSFEDQAQGAAGGAGGYGGQGGDDDYAAPERFEQDKENLIDFLRYPREKRKITDFLEETYKQYEQETVDRQINKTVHQHNSELQGSTPFHKPGHIGPLMHEYLNMVGVENAYVSGLQHTKSSLTKAVQQRVDEINTLLRMVGGFNRQLKASFSRSAVVYLEQDDPKNKHRENIIFTVNLGDFELRYPLDETADEQFVEDGRSLRRLVWDEAVNTLCEIVSNTGVKPKYVKNDKNTGQIVLRQNLLNRGEAEPDEFFTFELVYINDANRDKMTADYVAKVDEFDRQISKMAKRRDFFLTTAAGSARWDERIGDVKKDKDFFIATTPDPREMDTGLMFSIRVNTLKDYTVTKDRIQYIMTRYILALSNVAYDKSSDQQVNTVYQQKQAKATDFQSLAATGNAKKKMTKKPSGNRGGGSGGLAGGGRMAVNR